MEGKQGDIDTLVAGLLEGTTEPSITFTIRYWRRQGHFENLR